MTHQFPEIYTSLSELVSHILDNVGCSQDDRNRKVLFANVCEVFGNIKFVFKRGRFHIFGSRGEGSTGPGLKSDCDVLMYSLDVKVVTDLSQCQPELTNFLMVKDNHTHPGYVKLQRIDTTSNYIAIPLYGVGGETNTTDSFNRRVLRNTILHGVNCDGISGPALHLNNHMKEISGDIVYALRSSQWPNEGQHFLLRNRRNGWPTTMQMENARKYGCFVTPIAHPYSEERNAEWRLSFSIAEREMIRSFNDPTMKVYLLLKMVKKTYIEPFIGDAFSSYHCKVCMMWMRELLPSEIWRTENILQCLVLCIRQIYEWATMGFCPDFFIVENNIYDRKITGEVRNKLVKILWCLLSTSGTFLLGIQCCNLGKYVSIQMSAYDYNCFPIHFSFEVEDDSIILEEFVNCWLVIDSASCCRKQILFSMPQIYTTLVYYLNTLIRASQHLSYSMLCPLQHVQKFVWSLLGFHLVALCKENANLMSLEELDRDIALASRCLSFGINMDNSYVRLKICGLGIDLGNPNLLEVSLQHISANLMRCVFFASMVGSQSRNSWRNTLHRNRYNIVEILQTLFSFCVFYLPTEMSICPKPLRMEMFRSVGTPLELRHEIRDFWFDMAVINSHICLHFFQYLNLSRQGKVRQKQITIEKMAHFVSSNTNIENTDTAFNVLGYSLMLENKLPISFVCFVKSLIIRPHHNAAKFYLGILFNKINAINRCNTQYGSR